MHNGSKVNIFSANCDSRLIVSGFTFGWFCTMRMPLQTANLFSRALDLFVRDIFQVPRNILLFKLLIARKLNVKRKPRQFLSLYRYLSEIKEVSAPIRKHIQSLEDRSRSIPFTDSGEDAYGPVANLDARYCEWTGEDDQPTIESAGSKSPHQSQ